MKKYKMQEPPIVKRKDTYSVLNYRNNIVLSMLMQTIPCHKLQSKQESVIVSYKL